MSEGFEQDFQVIGTQLSNGPEGTPEELGGDEGQVAQMAANGLSMEEICDQMNLMPDQVWAYLNEALDRLQGTRWAEGSSGNIRPLDAENMQRPVQGI